MNTEQKSILSGFGESTTADEVIRGHDLSGKVVVVTGGHSGIGLETTRVLLRFHPGRIVSTQLSRFMSDEEKATAVKSAPTGDPRFVLSFVKSIAQGAATTIWAATSPQLNGMGGVYSADYDISPAVPDTSEQTDGVRRWAIDPTMPQRL